jgi:hypothetical protein
LLSLKQIVAGSFFPRNSLDDFFVHKA